MIKIIIDFSGVLISHIVTTLCYKEISNTFIKTFKLRNILFILLSSTMGYINNIINYNITRAIIHPLILTLLMFLIFSEDLKKTFVKNLMIYLVMSFFELSRSFIIILTNNISFYSIENNVYLKFFFSNLIVMFSLLVLNSEKFVGILNKIIKKLESKNSMLLNILFVIFFGGILLLLFKGAINLDTNIYISNILILIILILFFVFFIIQYIKTKNAEAKETILLELMSKYEKILDNDRINKHETLNNLLILKSFKDKNSEKYEETLNEIIAEYKNKDNDLFINLYNLPSGLKGLLYYKVYEMKNSNINVSLNISSKVLPKLEKMETKDFMKLCRILGIILDNARDASEVSKKKNIIIDIYKENKKIVIYIENTTKNKIEMNRIYEKNYTTKGKNHGLGLYIAKDIIRNSIIFELEQNINKSNNFVSILTII